MYDKLLDILADSCGEVLKVMANTESKCISIKEEKGESSFAVAQSTEYEHLDNKVHGQFVLGFHDESTAIQVASVLTEKLGIEPLGDEFNGAAEEVLLEFVNTVVGHTISEWDKLGLPVRFSPPSRAESPLKESNSQTESKVYMVVMSLGESLINFQVSFSERPAGKEDGADFSWLKARGARILVVDDSPLIRKILSLELTKAGFEVEQAENGREGIEKFKEIKPVLTIMDLVMPEVGGLQAIEKIRQLDPEAKIIVMTSTSRKDEVLAAKNLGVASYILKPVKPDLLLERIELVLK